MSTIITTPENITAEIIADRHKHLFSLGMAKTASGFCFRTLLVNNLFIEQMDSLEWQVFMDFVFRMVITMKKESANAPALVELSDKDKLQNFCKSLGQITGPELREERNKSHLEFALFTIGQARENLQEEVDLMP